MKRALVSTGAVALVFGISVLAVPETSFWRFWGSFWGVVVTSMTFGLSLWALNRDSRSGKIGRRLLIALLIAFGALVVNWIVAWRLSPFTLEGLWIYPLGLIPLGIAAALILVPMSARRDIWAQPPASAPESGSSSPGLL